MDMKSWKLRWYVGVQRLLARLGLQLPGKIMYIGGSDTLPPPLSKDEEAELIARLDGGDACRDRRPRAGPGAAQGAPAAGTEGIFEQAPGFPGGFEEGRRLSENAAWSRSFPGEPAWSAGGPQAYAARSRP